MPTDAQWICFIKSKVWSDQLDQTCYMVYPEDILDFLYPSQQTKKEEQISLT